MALARYTLKELDVSLKNILGDDVHETLVECYGEGRGRMYGIDMAVRECFLTGRDDISSDKLRLAVHDLDQLGSLNPIEEGKPT